MNERCEGSVQEPRIFTRVIFSNRRTSETEGRVMSPGGHQGPPGISISTPSSELTVLPYVRLVKLRLGDNLVTRGRMERLGRGMEGKPSKLDERYAR